MKEKRTTVAIEESLLKKAKQRAIEGDISLKELINEALVKQLEEPLEKKKNKFKLKTFDMGVMKTPLTREEIYEDHLNDIVRH